MTYRELYVCTGNVCRSPAAERMLRHQLDKLGLPGIEVSSAGTAALVGEPLSPPMALLIAKAGGDADGFVARQLEPALLKRADLVVLMTSAQRTAAVSLAPASVQYAYTLGQLATMLSLVNPHDIAAAVQGTDAGSRLAAAVALAKHQRILGVNPADDIVDPYERSAGVYAKSFGQIIDGLAPLVRAATGP